MQTSGWWRYINWCTHASHKKVFWMKTSACRDGTLKNQSNKIGTTPQHIYIIPTSCAILPTMLCVVSCGDSRVVEGSWGYCWVCSACWCDNLQFLYHSYFSLFPVWGGRGKETCSNSLVLLPPTSHTGNKENMPWLVRLGSYTHSCTFQATWIQFLQFFRMSLSNNLQEVDSKLCL